MEYNVVRIILMVRIKKVAIRARNLVAVCTFGNNIINYFIYGLFRRVLWVE